MSDAGMRQERARKAAKAMHEKHDGLEVTAAAREAFLGKFATPEEKSAYFRELARRSAEARKRSARTKDS